MFSGELAFSAVPHSQKGCESRLGFCGLQLAGSSLHL